MHIKPAYDVAEYACECQEELLSDRVEDEEVPREASRNDRLERRHPNAHAPDVKSSRGIIGPSLALPIGRVEEVEAELVE